MAERKRSKDGVKETEKVPGVAAGISEAGRAGGDIARDVASTDELKQTTKDPAGRTRVTKGRDDDPRDKVGRDDSEIDDKENK